MVGICRSVTSATVCVQASSSEAQVAAPATAEGLIFGRGDAGAWDSAAVGNPVVSADNSLACLRLACVTCHHVHTGAYTGAGSAFLSKQPQIVHTVYEQQQRNEEAGPGACQSSCRLLQGVCLRTC